MPISGVGKGTVLNTNVFEFPTGRIMTPGAQGMHQACIDRLPAVPVLPETLLTLDFLTQEYSVDLDSVSQVILRDLGATLQVLRLAAREYGNAPERPQRIQDCISDLGLRTCLEALECGSSLWSIHRRFVNEVWRHSREVAAYCRMIAEEEDHGIAPNDAWLAGLLHSIGILPDLLGWQGFECDSQGAAVALVLADRWCLPATVRNALCGFYMAGYDARWSQLLRAAHLVKGQTSGECPLTQQPAAAAPVPSSGSEFHEHPRIASR